MDASTIHALLADPDRAGSFADRARTQRRARLLATFPDIERMTVLDLGGTAGYWRHMKLRPADLTLVNLHDTSSPGVRMVIGDACAPPREALDRRYDLVLSNSVVDQVGGLEQRERLAAVIRGSGDRYWVQTANRGFPVDAYFLFPWFHRLPEAARVAVAKRWRVTPMHTRDHAEAVKRVRMIELQSAGDMRGLFPGARIITERFGGLAKSLVATG